MDRIGCLLSSLRFKKQDIKTLNNIMWFVGEDGTERILESIAENQKANGTDDDVAVRCANKTLSVVTTLIVNV